jgi:hypothetical protein
VEIFEKYSFFFKAKEGENFIRRNTLSISRIKIEPDTGIGEKGAFFKGF